MLIASGEDATTGRKRLFIGLHEENLAGLRDDRPILKALDDDPVIPGLEGWDIAIMGPEDLERFVARVAAL